MDVKEILKHVDHTLLLQPSTWEEIKQICDDAMEYGTASVCIPPSYVKQAAEYMNGKMAVCTVIGFPNGYMTTAAKEFETKDALANGASEIDIDYHIDFGSTICKRCSCKWCFRNRYGNQYRLAERSEI